MNNQIQLVLKSSTAEMSLNDQALGIYLTPELDGLVGLPEIRTTSGVNAGYDGGWTSAQNYDARSITIRGVIANENVATVERLRKQLVSLAGQGKSEELTLDLVTEAGNAYTLQARTIALEMSMQSVLTQQQFMLQLRADDPLIYDAGESEHEATLQVAQATGGFTIDFELPLAITGGSEESVVNNDGLEEVPTIVKMYGALHNPKIINQTNNEQIQIMADLGYAEGAWHTPSEASEGTNISLANTPDSAPFSDIQLKGDTTQNGTPTPSAPVAVQTVTGENVVKICGKNLFDKDNVNILQAYIDSTQSVITSNNYNRIVWIKCAPNTTYTVQRISPPSWNRGVAWTEAEPAVGVQTYGYVESNGSSITITTGSTAKYLVFRCYQGNGDTSITLDDVLDSIQIEVGATATAYEAYKEQNYEINLGKNLFDKANANVLNAYINLTSKILTSNSINWIVWIAASPNTTYTISVMASGWTREMAWTEAEPAVGVQTYGMVSLYGGQTSISLTTGATANYIVVRLWHNNNSSETWQQALDNLQIEKGSTATSYASYFTPIELCEIPNTAYQDYLYKSGGKWYVHKEVGKGIYDGSEDENWTSSAANRADIAISDAILGSSTNNPVLCNRYKAVWATANGNIFLSGITHGAGIVDSTNMTSISAWRTYLASNNVIIYYALATPIDTEITNEALIAQLDGLLNLSRTYQGQTNMADLAASGNMPAILNVSYFTEQDPDTRDELIIDSRLHTVTLNGLDIYHLIGEGSEFLMLEPGENRLSLQSDITGDNGYAVVSYKQGYLSI